MNDPKPKAQGIVHRHFAAIGVLPSQAKLE
jgi:hypothetical protein